MFYESNLVEPPFLEIPAHQYGPLGTNPEGYRANYTLLEPARPFYHSGYAWKGVVVPKPSLATVAANQQVEYRAQVPPGSWLLAFSGYSANQASGSNAGSTTGGLPGFSFTVYDEGAKRFALADKFALSQSDVQDNTDTDPAIPHVLCNPYCVIAPGWLQIRIKNAASVSQMMQLLLHFAVPGNPAAPYSSKAGPV